MALLFILYRDFQFKFFIFFDLVLFGVQKRTFYA